MDIQQLVGSLGAMPRRLRKMADLKEMQSRREPSFRARQDAHAEVDQLRADAKVVEEAHALLRRAIGGAD